MDPEDIIAAIRSVNVCLMRVLTRSCHVDNPIDMAACERFMPDLATFLHHSNNWKKKMHAVTILYNIVCSSDDRKKEVCSTMKELGILRSVKMLIDMMDDDLDDSRDQARAKELVEMIETHTV